MKIVLIVILIMLITSASFCETINVKTGYGYFKNKEGLIISKSELPEGTHSIRDGYTYVEVADRNALDSIIVPQPLVEKSDIQKRIEALENKIK